MIAAIGIGCASVAVFLKVNFAENAERGRRLWRVGPQVPCPDRYRALQERLCFAEPLLPEFHPPEGFEPGGNDRVIRTQVLFVDRRSLPKHALRFGQLAAVLKRDSRTPKGGAVTLDKLCDVPPASETVGCVERAFATVPSRHGEEIAGAEPKGEST